MRKGFTLQCALLRFCVPFFLLATFSNAPSVLATTQITGNEVNTDGKVSNEEFAKPSIQGHDEEAKFKGFFPKPIHVLKPIPKPIPIVKPVSKSIPNVKPFPFPFYKPTSKPIPIVKPILKPIPNEEAKFKPFFPKSMPVVKPIPKPFIVKKPIPTVESEDFLKPNHFFKKPIPKLSLDPKFKKPLLPPLPILKPIPTP